MLEKRIDCVINNIKKEDKFKLLSNEKLNLENIYDKINRIEKIANRCSTVKQAIKIDFNNDKIKSIKICIKKINESLDSSNFTTVNSNISELNSKIQDIENSLKLKWQLDVNEKSNATVTSLSNIGELFDDKREIENLILLLNGFSNRWPINIETSKEFENAINKSNKLISNLDLTLEIEMFIKKIINKTATFNDLTSDVVFWIRKNNFENKIKIGF